MKEIVKIDTSRAVVVVSHGSGVNGLSIVRSLGRRGVHCRVVALAGNLAISSRYCARAHRLEAEASEELRVALDAILSEGGEPPILLCDSDESNDLVRTCGSWLSDKLCPDLSD